MPDEKNADPELPDDQPDVKDAFRAALERKAGHRHPHEGASRAGAKIHDAHGAAGGRRTFRRKSG